MRGQRMRIPYRAAEKNGIEKNFNFVTILLLDNLTITYYFPKNLSHWFGEERKVKSEVQKVKSGGRKVKSE